MKTIFLSLLLLISSCLFAQTGTDRYIVLNADVYNWSSIRVKYVDYPKIEKGQTDTLVNRKTINGILGKSPVDVLDVLAKEGWVLVSAVYIPFGTNTDLAGVMHYYLKKTF